MSRVDIQCHVQQIDETGYVWTFLDRADPAVLVPGAIVVAGDEDGPVLARVVDLLPEDGDTVVHLEILPGAAEQYAQALARQHLVA